MTTKTKVEKTKALYDDMHHWILRGQYLRGAKLPTEAELSQRYTLSRSAVREVTARLKAEGLIVSRQGAGLFVATRPTTALDAPSFIDSRQDLDALFDFRLLIETESAALAARRQTPGDIERIEQKAQALCALFRKEQQGTQEDFDFHLQIAKTSGNKFLLSSLLALQTGVIFGARFNQPKSERDRLLHSRQVAQEHAAIVTALHHRDEVSAREAMKRHIEASRLRIRV
ncbi:FCD domain-containing protein [Halomonas sp. PAMB 3264]|uniref:FadR/GntR family transcriptional regulator n=1 Tax=unclassified Halomonas TaxID=2609666 RepID=UPI0028992849|nr:MULTISPECIES: FCD domain-containing protein [unclassified Halomonas]WNL38256.1 FCD domain-containing protein [Halomonas sp. PAMB 3232]WNL41556.1 FCD domain-containing protein [Halomonas sp. PAMB 3264]